MWQHLERLKKVSKTQVSKSVPNITSRAACDTKNLPMLGNIGCDKAMSTIPCISSLCTRHHSLTKQREASIDMATETHYMIVPLKKL